MASLFRVALTAIFAICVAVLAVQVIYFSVFVISFGKDRLNPQTNVAASVSVIVCAHDEEENLRQLVPVLLSQDYGHFEVIVVNDRSNDGTYDYLLKTTNENPRVRMVTVRDTPKHMNGKKFALTMGIKAAKNDWVLLTDADCRPGPHWISEMSQHIRDNKSFIIGFSPYEKHPGFLNSFIRFEAFVTAIQYFGFALSGRPYMGVGRNLAYRRSLFLESKGFNNHLDVLGGDDDLFVNEHATSENVSVATGSGVLVRSVPKKTWSEYFHQKLRHLSVGAKYKFSDRILLGLFSVTWILSLFTWIALPYIGPYQTIVGALILLRVIMLYVLFNVASKRLGEPFEEWKVPFLDFIYGFYYLVAGPIALVTKRVRWKI